MSAELTIRMHLRESVVRAWAGREFNGVRPVKTKTEGRLVYQVGDVTLTYTPSGDSGSVVLEGPAESLPIFARASHRLADLARSSDFRCEIDLCIPCSILGTHKSPKFETDCEWVEFRLLHSTSILEHRVRRAEGTIWYPQDQRPRKGGRRAPKYRRENIVITVDADAGLLLLEKHRFFYVRDVVRLMQLLHDRFFLPPTSLPPEFR